MVKGMLANDTAARPIYAVPWFGGVRGMWYRKDQFAKAGISSHADDLGGARWPTRKLLMKKDPGT